MKKLQNINIFFISITVCFGLLSIVDRSFIIGTLISLFFLGVYQGFTGLIMFLSHPSRVQNVLYISGLLLVFLLICLDTEWLWMVPPIPLCLYFTFLLYTKSSQNERMETI